MEILGQSLAQLQATRTSQKWRSYPADVLPVWVAEMDSRPCPEVAEAVMDAVRRGDTGYTDASSTAQLLAASAEFATRSWDWSPDPGRAVASSDVMGGIRQLITDLTPADSPVVVNPPCYNSFWGLVSRMERQPVAAPLDDSYRLDGESLARAFAEAGPGAAYILCNPQNPTGTLHTADELRMVAELADRHGIVVISDEIHAPLVRPGGTFVPYLSLPEARRGFAVHSASKAFNLAGLRGAIIHPGSEVAADLARTRSHHEVPQQLATIAQTTAYRTDGTWLDQLLSEIDARHTLLAALLTEHLPQVTVTPAEATYLAWLDCSALGVADPFQTFLDRGRVALVTGKGYDPSRPTFCRFNVATSPEVLTEAVLRMARAVELERVA